MVSIRPLQEGDEPVIEEFLNKLSRKSLRLRYFSVAVDLQKAATWAAEITSDRYSLLAYYEGELVAHAVYIKTDDEHAEVAVEVLDHFQQHGIATVLIEKLAEVAETRGVRYFQAVVLPDNRLMLAVFKDGFGARAFFKDGDEMIEFPTSSWRAAQDLIASNFHGPVEG